MGNSEVGHLESRCRPDRLSGSHPHQQGHRGRRARHETRFCRRLLRRRRGHRLHLLGLGLRWRRAQPLPALLVLWPMRRKRPRVERHHGACFHRWAGHFAHGGAPVIWRPAQQNWQPSGANIVTVVGRYFAMDRDRRWDRTKKAWDAIVLGAGGMRCVRPSPKRWRRDMRPGSRMSSCPR